MKWALYVILGLVIAGGWAWFVQGGEKLKEDARKIEFMQEQGEADEMIEKAQAELHGEEGTRTFQGILLAFLSAGLVGVIFVAEILPMMAQKITHSVYDSAEMMEKDVMHDARAFLAQGEYEGAIVAFRAAAAKEPENRMPWTEIARIQKDHLHDPAAAVATMREALETKAWPQDDSAFMLFRLAEIYHDAMNDEASAYALMQQVIDQFPNTRHSANAAHKIQEWTTAGGENVVAAAAGGASLEDEEAEFLAKLREREAEAAGRGEI